MYQKFYGTCAAWVSRATRFNHNNCSDNDTMLLKLGEESTGSGKL